MGVRLPKITNLDEYFNCLANGKPTYEYLKLLKDKNLSCQVGGWINLSKNELDFLYEKHPDLRGASGSTLLGVLSGLAAWKNAKLELRSLSDNTLDYKCGVIIGSGFSTYDYNIDIIGPKVNNLKSKKIGSLAVQNMMNSNCSSHLAALIGAGNISLGVSNSCCSSTDAIVMAYDRIRFGFADRMLIGGVEESSVYIWSAFDSMRVLANKYNDSPHLASRPMSDMPNGFVPSGGSGAVVLESLESAISRNATILGEIKSGVSLCGGQKNNGSMTYPNVDAVIKCITNTIDLASVNPADIDLINGHLTSTKADVLEISNWVNVFKKYKSKLPNIQALKSIIGHTLGAAGVIETIASLMQIERQCIFPTINSNDLHPKILELIGDKCVVRKCQQTQIDNIINANFGFGDVNSCIMISKYLK